MAFKSKIQWTEGTWNPWHGCKKVSPGCKFCYMYRDKERFNQDPTTVLRSKSAFTAPLKWDEPKLIFTCSWSDWFIKEADEWRDEAWDIIKRTPQHTYQILTKRPERIEECLPDDWGFGYDNVWLGVSVENESTKWRVNTLCDVEAKVRFISAEPLIGQIDFRSDEIITRNFDNQIDWVIIGGESGNDSGKYQYRECKLEWMNQIVKDCEIANVPVFVKQLGTYLSKSMGLKNRHGGDLDEFPESLKHRQMPNSYKKTMIL